MPLPSVTPRDIFLARELSEADARAYLADRGFRHAAEADRHLQQLAEDLPTRQALGALADALFDTLTRAPDPDAALVGFCRYAATRLPKSAFIGYLLDDPRVLEILTHLLGASPFLSEILIRNPESLHWLQRELDRPPPDHVDYARALDDLLGGVDDPTQRIDALKRFKRREMLRIAGRDLLDKDSLRAATEQLSRLADLVTEGTLRRLSDEMFAADGGRPPGRFVIIGMGKLGGNELNYSSDIDLIYVYEPDDPEDSTTHEVFQKFGRQLTTRLSEHDDEGYLYRVDLRLRPMGKRGNIAYSLAQSAQYYEDWGETFERFALIKARPIAGDIELGRRFVELVRPFVYRKYLDHAAVEELARYKARSDREHARGAEGHRNVKQGRGGIREIELFTQVFQLIYGGTHGELQDANTLSALTAVQRLGFVEEDVRAELTRAYEFLRAVEHRLQLVQEGQTHTLSDDPVELEITARRMGFTTAAELESELNTHRERVHAAYANLLERRADEAEFQGRQLFRLLSGELADDEATAHLQSYGLGDAKGALQAVRALDDAPSLAHSKSSTRNLLANLLATTLEEIVERGSPNRVLNRLEQIVSRTGAPASLYRSLLENDALRDRLLWALDTGDLFAQRLGRYPELLDVLAMGAAEIGAGDTAFRRSLSGIDAATLNDCRDPFRRIKAIEEFKALAEWLAGGTLEVLTRKLSGVADAALQWIAERAARDTLEGDDRWVLAALGKLGGDELTVHSDLDLVFLYDGDPGDSPSFERHQSFVRAIYEFLERPTAEGVAYRVDTRLRPEGKKGALAIPVVAFGRYLEEWAEIWERMAWTRCRFVAGDAAVVARADRVRRTFVYGPWNPEIPGYVRLLRARMERELAREADGRRLDFKVGRGGLADIDFLLQVLQIREGYDDEVFRLPGTRRLLERLPETPYISTVQADCLRESYAFLRTLETVLRIESDAGVGYLSTAPEALEPIVRHFELVPATPAALLHRYREVTDQIRAIFEDAMTKLEG